MPSVNSHEIQISYEVVGTGPPLLLLHSLLCSKAMWRDQVPVLSERWMTINVDSRGHGESGPVLEPFSLDEMVDDALAVLDDIGIHRAVWAGLSTGGVVALRAALRHPDRVTGLILLDTDGGPESRWNRVKYEAMNRVSRLVGLRPLLPKLERQFFGESTRK